MTDPEVTESPPTPSTAPPPALPPAEGADEELCDAVPDRELIEWLSGLRDPLAPPHETTADLPPYEGRHRAGRTRTRSRWRTPWRRPPARQGQ